MNQKLKIAVLFGGCSPEYGVSLQSAAAVLRHMDREKYEPVMVGISQVGDWFLYTGPVGRIEDGSWNSEETCARAALSPSRSRSALLVFEERTIRRISLDAAFPVLHGQNGEDGTVQGLFELAGIPLVGCGVLSSALCMDKDRAHKRGQLPAALELAFAYDDHVILEEAIPGFEVGCAVMGNETLTVGEPDEIDLQGDFFDYQEKYTLKTSAIHVPARITPAERRRIQENAKTVYRALDCRGFARVDQFLTPEGRLVFNEVNTLPGFTAHSRYPNMMKAAGLSFEQVISALIELAVRP